MLAILDFDGGLAEVLRLIEEKFGVGTFVWNIHPEVIRWSDGMFALFGLAPGSVAPSFQLIQAITHPQDRRSPGALNKNSERSGPRHDGNDLPAATLRDGPAGCKTRGRTGDERF